MARRYNEGRLISPMLIDYDALIDKKCSNLHREERDTCMERQEETVNKNYDKAQSTCQDVVWHRGTMPSFQSCETSRHGTWLPEKVKRELGTDCVLYATPDLADQQKFRYISRGASDAILAVCVDPDKSFVSEDVDSPLHPKWAADDKYDYYVTKLITLREYREKKLNYQFPEVLVPGLATNDQVLGGVGLIKDKYFPYKCACEESRTRPLLNEGLKW